MNKRLVMVFFFLAIVLSFGSKEVLAAGFNLKSIGSVDTSGRQISHWWYSGSTPVMVGEAPSGSAVTISVDGTDATVTAGGNNDWTYSPGALSSGDHKIIITNNGSTISFTLTMGAENVDWEAVNADAGTTTLPTVGIIFPTILLSSAGAGLMLTAKRMAKKK